MSLLIKFLILFGLFACDHKERSHYLIKLNLTTNSYVSPCPTNFVLIPSNLAVGVASDFCVAKFEMKATTDGSSIASSLVNGGNGNFVYAATYYATSRADGTPWINITRTQAVTECNRLNTLNGLGASRYALITNEEWQSIARNLEGNTANWSSGTIGTGVLNTGNKDGAVSATAIADGLSFAGIQSLAASSTLISFSDTTPYVGTGQSNPDNWSGGTFAAGEEQKRTFPLSNGEIIWDFGGNVWEWVSNNIAGGSLTPTINTGGWISGFNNVGYFANALSTNSILLAPLGLYDKTKNVGTIYGSNAGAAFRGGGYDITGDESGIFSAVLILNSTTADAAIGFRCAYHP